MDGCWSPARSPMMRLQAWRSPAPLMCTFACARRRCPSPSHPWTQPPASLCVPCILSCAWLLCIQTCGAAPMRMPCCQLGHHVSWHCVRLRNLATDCLPNLLATEKPCSARAADCCVGPGLSWLWSLAQHCATSGTLTRRQALSSFAWAAGLEVAGGITPWIRRLPLVRSALHEHLAALALACSRFIYMRQLNTRGD